MTLVHNPRRRAAGQPLLPAAEELGPGAAREVLSLLSQCPIYAPTPLWRLDALAGELGLGGVAFKDESFRLGLNSFKALGGVYAAAEIAAAHAAKTLGRKIDPAEQSGPEVRCAARELTLVGARDGNHGRAVAAGARWFGARCVVFLHEGVSQARCDWIAALDAEVRRTAGTYDHSVEAARQTALREGWILVPDTAEDAAAAIPRLIMRGYTVLIQEALDQLGRAPSHIFVQAGVGGLAAAVAGYCASRFGDAGPRIIVVEPERANCLLQSCQAGEPIEIPQGPPTLYAMLECLRPSQPAWMVLDPYADDFMDVPDSAAAPAMRRLARPLAPDPEIVSGESGASGLAALLTACADPDARRALGLSGVSTVLLIGTEGATDPAVYRRLVGELGAPN